MSSAVTKVNDSIGPVHIIGAGLAGSEAAYFLAQRNIKVILHEMRPGKTTPAHSTGKCAELVCSNSLKSTSAVSATGMLKAEMQIAGSILLDAAEETKVPAGEALAVDRELFSAYVTDKLTAHPNITIDNAEIEKPFSDGITILASGPLTTEKLCSWIASHTNSDDLYFYDAIAPIVDAASIDSSCSFMANRYDKGEEEAYLNCPMNEEEYYAFIEALGSAETVKPRAFEKEKFFSGCQPVEAILGGGRESLRFGPMKPVGLTDPKSGRRPYAVVQLRAENRSRTAYNLVGFQTKLAYAEQARVFRMIPALKKAEFLRMGSIHRNTYVCGPSVLRGDLSLKGHPKVYVAGQLTGVEGYLESGACGILAAIFVHQRILGLPHTPPAQNTAMGALLNHVVASEPKNYQPSNMHFGLFDPNYFYGASGLKRDQLRETIAAQTKANFKSWWINGAHRNAD